MLAVAPDASMISKSSANASAARSPSSARPPRKSSSSSRTRISRTRPSTCRSTCCSASRRACTATCAHRPHCRRPRQLVHSASIDSGSRLSRAAPADRRRQDFPHHHRRPHRRRTHLPRPDGRPVAGAGGRLRRDRRGLRRLHRRGHGHGRTHAGRGQQRRRVRPPRRRRSAHQSRRRADRRPRQGQPLRQLDGRRRPSPATAPTSTPPCRPSAWSCARRSASPSRSARIR